MKACSLNYSLPSSTSTDELIEYKSDLSFLRELYIVGKDAGRTEQVGYPIVADWVGSVRRY